MKTMIVTGQDGIPSTLATEVADRGINELHVEENAKTEAMATLDCKTPTAKEHKIPDVVTCPPAPRKHKVSVPVMKRKSPNRIRVLNALYASLDLESLLKIDHVSSKIPWSSYRSSR